MKDDGLILVDDISYHADGKRILYDISCSFSERCITTIIGPNGGGKTSFIELIIGLNKPHSGSIKRRDNIVIGYVPQKLSVDPILPITVKRFLEIMRKDRVIDHDVLDIFDIRKIENSFLYSLSEGELQKVFLVVEILSNPDVLVMDEPTSALDIHSREVFYKEINCVRDKFNCAVIITSHDLYAVMQNTDHVICLNGHICCEGKPADFFDNEGFLNVPGFVSYRHHHNHIHDCDNIVQK